jgi:hypothetical protein
VEAVVVHSNMLREADTERCQRSLGIDLKHDGMSRASRPLDSSEAASAPLKCEEVLVMQLHYRARLLNEAFQSEVLSVIQRHKAAEDNLDPSVNDLDGFEPAKFGPASPSLMPASPSLLPTSLGPTIPKMAQTHRREPSQTSVATSSRANRLRKSLGSMGSQTIATGLLGLMGGRRVSHANVSDYEWSVDPGEAPTATSTNHFDATDVLCTFSGEGREVAACVAPVTVQPAPVKTVERALEKLKEYAADGAVWPLAACILDPVRASVVCECPAHMVEVAQWFVRGDGAEKRAGSGGRGGLRVCRIKNKFAMGKEQLVHPSSPAAATAYIPVCFLIESAFHPRRISGFCRICIFPSSCMCAIRCIPDM